MRRFVLLVVSLVAAGGCAEEHGTSGRNVEILPSIPLTSDPVLYSSRVIPMQPLPDSDFVADMDSLVDGAGDSELEIRVSFERRSCSENVSVWNPVSAEWVVVESTNTGFGCIPEVPPGTYLLSYLGISPRAMLEASGNQLHLNTARSRWATVQVLGIRSDYQKLLLPRNSHPSALAWNGNLYVATRTIPGYLDSLLMYSPDGTRLLATTLPYYANSMAWTPDGLWIMHGHHPALITLYDSAGLALGEFSHAADKCGKWASSITAGIIWYQDHLLMYDKCDSMLYWVDGMASIAAGEMIIRESLRFDKEQEAWCLATDGESILFVFPNVRAYTASGQFVYQFPAPTSFHGAVYDGEALWLGHPMQGIGYVEAISRFTLE